MAKVFASGSLVGAAQESGTIWFKGESTGAVGLLFTGTFSTAQIQPFVEDPQAPNEKSYGFFVPSDGSRLTYTYTATGLYYIEGVYDSLVLAMSLGDGTTDIDWALFLKPRS